MQHELEEVTRLLFTARPLQQLEFGKDKKKKNQNKTKAAKILDTLKLGVHPSGHYPSQLLVNMPELLEMLRPQLGGGGGLAGQGEVLYLPEKQFSVCCMPVLQKQQSPFSPMHCCADRTETQSRQEKF